MELANCRCLKTISIFWISFTSDTTAASTCHFSMRSVQLVHTTSRGERQLTAAEPLTTKARAGECSKNHIIYLI